jgi:hypothetical protein
MGNVSPMRHLKTVMNTYPGMSSWAKFCLERKGIDDFPDWPNWCFLPSWCWAALAYRQNEHMSVSELFEEGGFLSVIGAWRYSQGIYRMDADLLSALTETDMAENLPSELFQRMPEWSIYVETPGLPWGGSPINGFWASVDLDFKTQDKYLWFVLNADRGLLPFCIELGVQSVDELMRKAMEMMSGELNSQCSNFAEGSVRRNFQELRSLISIVLYLCSSEPDIDPARMPNSTTRELPFRKGKKGKYLFTPDKPRVFRVGGTLGGKLRGAAVQASRKTVKTHLRRAHWHGFWKGPRSGERTFFYRWIAPLVVEGKKQSEMVLDESVM